MNIQIREANLDDIEMLYRLNKEELGYDFELENMRIRLSNILNTSSNKIVVNWKKRLKFKCL